jgi:hypothetical protein
MDYFNHYLRSRPAAPGLCNTAQTAAAAGKPGHSTRDGNRRVGFAAPESAGAGVDLMVFHF